MSTFIWRVSSECPGTQSSVSAKVSATKAKSIGGQWSAMPRDSTERRGRLVFWKSQPVTTQPACIENCIIRQLEESVLRKWTRRSSSCSPGGHSIPRCLDRTTVCHTADNHKNLWKYALKLTLTEESFFYPNITSTLVSVWGMHIYLHEADCVKAEWHDSVDQ